MKSRIKTTSTALTAAQSPQSPPAPTPQVELLTQVQMAQRLGISRRTLHTWVINGMVPMIKIRGYCRFEPAKVWAALQRCEVSAASAPESFSSSSPYSSSRKGVLSTTDAQAAPNAAPLTA